MRNCDSLIQVMSCIGKRLMHPLREDTLEASSLTPLTCAWYSYKKSRTSYKALSPVFIGNYVAAAAGPLDIGVVEAEGVAAAELPAPLPPPPVLRPRPLLGGPRPPPLGP